MSKRKDIERAQKQGGIRNEGKPGVREQVEALASKVDVSDVVAKGQMTLDEIKDCRRCYTLGKMLPTADFRARLMKGLKSDFSKKVGELKRAGKPYDVEAIVNYYWSEPEFQKTCSLAQITKDDITYIAGLVTRSESVTMNIETMPEPKKKPWWRIL